MAISEYLPVAVAAGANVTPQASFAGSAWQQVGFVTGTAKAPEANKIWRQATMFSAAWSTLIVNILGQNSLDDGNVPNLSTQLQSLVTTIATAALNASGLAARVTTLEATSAALVGFANNAGPRITALETQYNALALRVGTNEGNIANNTAAINALTGRVASLEGLYATLNTSLNSLWTQFNALYNQVQGLAATLSTHETEIADLYYKTGSNAVSIQANTNSINVLNGEIPPINAHLGVLDQQVASLNPATTRNQYGTFVRTPDGAGGYIYEGWGTVQAAVTGNRFSTATINYPGFFPGTPVVVVSGGGIPSNAGPDSMCVYTTRADANSASVALTCAVNIGGSGAPGFQLAVPVNWHARY